MTWTRHAPKMSDAEWIHESGTALVIEWWDGDVEWFVCVGHGWSVPRWAPSVGIAMQRAENALGLRR